MPWLQEGGQFRLAGSASMDGFVSQLIINTYVSLKYELKKMERYLRVNLLGPDPRLMKKEFTGPRFHKG